MKTKAARMKTRSILGYKLTLAAGRRYLATRPIAGEGIRKGRSERFPIMITDMANPFGDAVVYVDDMPYNKANMFLNAFNNGTTTFDGRLW